MRHGSQFFKKLLLNNGKYQSFCKSSLNTTELASANYISEIVCVDICANTRGIQIDGEIISASSIRHCGLVVLIDINICFN